MVLVDGGCRDRYRTWEIKLLMACSCFMFLFIASPLPGLCQSSVPGWAHLQKVCGLVVVCVWIPPPSKSSFVLTSSCFIWLVVYSIRIGYFAVSHLEISVNILTCDPSALTEIFRFS